LKCSTSATRQESTSRPTRTSVDTELPATRMNDGGALRALRSHRC
jgi:hypothetical protein